MPLNNPPVTVIALCYNHGRFLEESLQSVVNQTYPNIELIIVDDFSGDNSREKILSFIKNNTNTQFIFNESNLGNCRSFNNALRIAKGEFIIDLSTDDVMVPERVFEQVKKFQKSSDKTGVVFTDGIYIDENSKPFKSGQMPKNQPIPEGDVYQEFLKGSFLMPCTLSMAFLKSLSVASFINSMTLPPLNQARMRP